MTSAANSEGASPDPPYGVPSDAPAADGRLPGGAVELAWQLDLPFRAKHAKVIIVGGLVTLFVVSGILTQSWISLVLALGVLVVFALPDRKRAAGGAGRAAGVGGSGRGAPSLSFRMRLVPGEGITLYSPQAAQVLWSDLTKVEDTPAGLVFTTHVERKDILVVPASALTPDTIAAVRAVVEASAPGRFVAQER